MTADTGTESELRRDYETTEEHVSVEDMFHDIEVNPRNPSDTWVREQMPDYNPALLGTFILSERLPADGSGRRVLAILDGANRASLVRLAGDEKRDVHARVFHGLTRAEEARIALEYNDRRAWTSIRSFQARCTAGDAIALAIRDILSDNGWEIDTLTAPGVLKSVKPFEKLLRTAELLAALESKAQRGTERWKAAEVSGRQDGLRVLREAVEAYTAAFPARPASYSAQIIYGLALVLLRFGSEITMERLVTQVREQSGGQHALHQDARQLGKTMRLSLPDAVALLSIKFYNKGLPGSSRARLDEHWQRTAR